MLLSGVIRTLHDYYGEPGENNKWPHKCRRHGLEVQPPTLRDRPARVHCRRLRLGLPGVGGEVRRPWVPCHRPVWVLRNRVLEPLEYCRAVPRGVLACEWVVEGDDPLFHVDDDQSPVYGAQVLAWEYDMLHRQPVGVVAPLSSFGLRDCVCSR